MDAITIKPHHFTDILKLYGGGIEVFVPDERMGHDFYRVANRILAEPALALRLTVEGDDICQPCRWYQGRCRDTISHIPGIESKDAYNCLLDSRILELFGLEEKIYPALGLCQALYQGHEKIFAVWKEESASVTQKRHDLFVRGAEKYIASAFNR